MTTSTNASTPTASALGVTARGLVHIYRVEGNDVVALSGVDLDVVPGQAVALLGPSGSGKSTLIALLSGLQRPSAGVLRVGEQDLLGLDDAGLDDLRAGSVGTVLQGARRNLLPYLDARGNVAFAQREARRRGLDVPEPHDVLALLGLADLSRTDVRTLTPGQVQRLAVAVGVASGPGLLLADEPTSQLDHHYRDEVIDALHTVNTAGTTVVAVTHDPEVAARMPRTVTIRDGRVGAEGRGGQDFAVVGRDGTVQLPPELREDLPAGTLLRVHAEPGGRVVLVRDDGDTAGTTGGRS